MATDDLVIGCRYWWDNGIFWTVLELRNVYKNGRVRLIETAKDGGGAWLEVKTQPDRLYGPTDVEVGAHRRAHPALIDPEPIIDYPLRKTVRLHRPGHVVPRDADPTALLAFLDTLEADDL